MGAGIFNVCVGLAAIALAANKFTVGGKRYQLLFLGDNPTVVMAVGGALAAFGVYQVVRSLMRRKPPVNDD